MINCIVYKNNENIIGFELEGHANYAEYGNDILCASVSVLIINTINAIDHFTEDVYDLEQDESTGYMFFKLNESISEQSTLLLNALELGLQSIYNEYGSKYLNVSYKEV